MNEKKDQILFVDACVRKDSRTRRLAEYILSRMDGKITRVKPAEVVCPIQNEEFLLKRDREIAKKIYDDECYTPAKQFAAADTIIVAAPYWDLSFPAVLKAYFEQINVLGITFEYTEEGLPKGLCKAKKLIYVTTAGGPIYSDEYGFGYVRMLARTFYEIPEITQVKAEGLDLVGADVEKILRETMVNYQ